MRLLHCRFTVPNAGLIEPTLGGPAQETTQHRLFAAASSNIPTDFAAALLARIAPVDKLQICAYTITSPSRPAYFASL
jgi:hypothetical protein